MQNTTFSRPPPAVVLCELAETGMRCEHAIESFSPFCLKIHRTLRYAGIPYTSRRGSPRDHRHLNPRGQVPVLLAEGEPIADSTAILRSILAWAPRSGLEPADPRLAAEAWLWEDWADRALNGWLVAARWADDDNWPAVRDAYFGEAPWFVRKIIVPRIRAQVVRGLRARDVIRGGMAAAWDDFGHILDHLERRAPHAGFWLGESRPTLADVALFAQLHSLRTPLTPRQAQALKLRPALTDWLDRVDEATRLAELPTPARSAAAA
jgi:glutathione S-transferase